MLLSVTLWTVNTFSRQFQEKSFDLRTGRRPRSNGGKCNRSFSPWLRPIGFGARDRLTEKLLNRQRLKHFPPPCRQSVEHF